MSTDLSVVSVVEDGEETFIGRLIPKDKKTLCVEIIKLIRFYSNGYFQMAQKDEKNINICIWKLHVYRNKIEELESIVGVTIDTQMLKEEVETLQSSFTGVKEIE